MQLDEQTEVQPSVRRQPYSSPTLQTFGSVRDLTAAGSGGKTELNPDGSCNISPIKARC
jgi:hypothetical protein